MPASGRIREGHGRPHSGRSPFARVGSARRHGLRRCPIRWLRFHKARGGGFVFTRREPVRLRLSENRVRRVRFRDVRPGAQHRIIERVHRLPAARQSAPLVEAERGEAFQHGRIGCHGFPRREDVAACAPYAHDVDVRRRNAEREREALSVRAVAGNRAREYRDRFRPGGVGNRRPVEPVTARVLRRAGLAGRVARAGAAQRVAAVGRGPDGADHHRSSRCRAGSPPAWGALSLT